MKRRHDFNSVRAYRQFVNAVARECYAGKRPFEDATRAAAIAKVGAELLMVEQTLAATGVVDQAPATPHGDIERDNLPEPGLFSSTSVKEKSGISAKGTEIEETVREHVEPGEPLPLPGPEDF